QWSDGVAESSAGSRSDIRWGEDANRDATLGCVPEGGFKAADPAPLHECAQQIDATRTRHLEAQLRAELRIHARVRKECDVAERCRGARHEWRRRGCHRGEETRTRGDGWVRWQRRECIE